MRLISLTFLILIVNLNFSLAQNNEACACCSNNYNAFDFWIGDWIVYNTKGEIIGTNEIIKMQNGCVLQENWEASDKKNTGTSYNYFDTGDSTWNQLWISNTGNILKLKGNINSDGNMVLKSKLISGPKGNYYNQIIWSENDDGTVRQRWVILNENNEIISNAFEGIYKKGQ
jgi:hypothetical protein